MSTDPTLDRAAADLLARHPEAAGPLAGPARDRLTQVLGDPAGQVWMDRAGLLDTDSCGYPVEGGLPDVRSDLAAAVDPATAERVLGRLQQLWVDDYVLTGRARRDRRWQDLMEVDAPRA